MKDKQKQILKALKGEKTQSIPFWLMRQAGRYLPEYRKVREEAGSFLDLVYDSEKAAEVTLQPLRRFGMDAAILFSDILVIPDALGQPVRFVEGEGPRLEPVSNAEDLKKLDVGRIDETLFPVYETVSKTREKLSKEGFDNAALIGFSGSPWTLACYMAEGKGSRDFLLAKSWAARDPQGFMNLIDIISSASLHYLSRQIEAGAEAVQLFDSWAGVLDEEMFRAYVIGPTKSLVASLKERHPDIPVIGFPRGGGVLCKDYLQQTGVDAIGVDYALPAQWARDHLQPYGCVQGNMDPVYLMSGGNEMRRAAEKILEDLSGGPFVFNLGHGVIKETPAEHITQLADIIRNFRLR
ncbi:MAG: uroporphyrinogen decarboxylase [Rhodospirillales bacterium]|nr:uroporphyrinogen decarboxylase [Alphaproteobacteria bacterium]USO04572.1 MAG: uroporphyrinogen decarboxylase [Rhodospirillales bacterium]